MPGMSSDMFSRTKLNTELIANETQPYLGRAEKKALKQAEQAEQAFRASKGYEPDTAWTRLKKRLKK